MTIEKSEHYEQVTAVIKLRAVPRFGFSKDFGVLFSDDFHQQNKYFWGTLYLPFIFTLVFAVLASVHITLSCLGARRVGFFSGHGFIQPRSETENYRRPKRVRMAFLVFAVLTVFLVMSLIRVTKNLYGVTASLFENTSIINSLTYEGSISAKSHQDIAEEAKQIAASLIPTVRDFCSNDYVTRKEANALADLLEQIQTSNFALDELKAFEGAFHNFSHVTNKAAQVFTAVNLNLKYEALYWSPLIICTTVLSIGTILAWLNVLPVAYYRIQRWIVYPIFVLWIVFSLILSCISSFFAIVNADVCSGGPAPGTPEGTINAVINAHGYTSQSPLEQDALLYNITNYFMKCEGLNPFEYVKTYSGLIATTLNEGGKLVSRLEELLDSGAENPCGVRANKVAGGIQKIVELLGSIMAHSLFLSTFTCDKINPVYVQTVHRITCDLSVTALSW
eukprot:CAMPEP_0195515144 /NCGR_PEP_ID=MMETSP0794_2-20130614/6320_1 /TAXON_ID=515487 /ORGANISM="Stephanopyxis turris, Strain CCMP 815" /LENGTH=448 /DNA_ID=CAMNT_0040643527 /DNA_START=169 /DNA_END=1512 /DNA_ORIENTATION=-